MPKKILIVDDEVDILSSVKEVIESMGYEGKTAISGGKALKQLKQEHFDLVLLDMLMPEMSGEEILEKIRADPKLKSQKVAFLTVVRLGEEGRRIVKKLKPVGYFQKPIEPDDFRKNLKKILK